MISLRGYDDWKQTEPDDYPECPRCCEERDLGNIATGDLCPLHALEAAADAAEDEADREMEDRMFGED